MKKADYELLLMQLGDGTAHLRPEHFLSALYARQNEDDFAKTLDATLLSIAALNADIFSVKTEDGEKIVLFDPITEYVASKRNEFARAIINKVVNFSFEHIFTPKDLSRNTGNKFITRGETGVTDAGIKGASLTLLPIGTVLMSSRAPIGYTAIARNPVTTNQGFKSFVPSKGYSTEFIYYTLNHLMKAIEQNASGSTFKEVSAGTLKSIRTQLPDLSVLSEFSKLLQPIFSQQDNLEQQNQELTTLRDWLLPMLMNGQVRVG
jgi:hypothetical protein